MTDQQHTRYLAIRWILIWTLFLNWGVAIAKLTYGLITNSLSMTADGFHSISDGTSNIICLVGIWIASRPTDHEHPYGHKKYETLTSIGIAALLFFISFNLLKEVVVRFYRPVMPDVTPLSFGVMVATMAVNFFVMTYEYKKGKALDSDILVSDSMHTRTDIYASLSVIVALIAVKVGFPVIDLVAGIFISVLIALCGIQIVRESSYVLCDGAPVDTHKIEEVVLKMEGARRCHKIRTRGRQDDIHVDLHISVDTNMHVDKAHYLSHQIQDKIKQEVKGVTDVIVHIEPF